MRSKTIVLLESNEALLRELKSTFEKEEEVEVVYAGDDGEVGVQELRRLKPQLVFVGMFLKGTDGCGVIQALKKESPDTKIIATGVAGDALMEKAIASGADYYLVKPFSVQSALERAEELIKPVSATERDVREIKGRTATLEEKISDIFIAIGIPPHIKGYRYLRTGIKMAVEMPYIINNVTKELYPNIAKQYDTTPSKVERAIRHAIEVAWNRARIEAINAVFGTRVYLGTEKPTNSEFIALVADKLILESMTR